MFKYRLIKTFGEDQNALARMSDIGTPRTQAIEKASLRMSCPLPWSVFAKALMALASQYDTFAAERGFDEVRWRNTWPLWAWSAVEAKYERWVVTGQRVRSSVSLGKVISGGSRFHV